MFYSPAILSDKTENSCNATVAMSDNNLAIESTTPVQRVAIDVSPFFSPVKTNLVPISSQTKVPHERELTCNRRMKSREATNRRRRQHCEVSVVPILGLIERLLSFLSTPDASNVGRASKGRLQFDGSGNRT